MKLTELYVENYKRIVAVHIRLGEHVTEISGPNEAGKSSTIDAIWALLKGKRVAPPEPIRQGAERSRIRGRIGEFVVTRTFQRSKSGEITTSLRIERDNESFPPTEAQMRDLIGEHMLDPGDFIRLKPDEKFDVLRAFVPDVDFAAIARQDKKDYDRRTDVNRMADDARAAAAMIVLPAGTPTSEVDESALVAQLNEAGKTNAELEQRKARREDVGRQMLEARSAVESARDRAAELRRQAGELDGQAEEHEVRYATLKRRLDEAPELPDPIDTEQVVKQIEEARKTNANVKRAADAKKHLETAERYEAESKTITERMKARERAKHDAIAAAKMPVVGLSFGDGEILLDGLPFEQASTARKFRVGVAIAVAKNPKLRLVWVRDASLLDNRSYELVAQLAKEFDCQILLETVRAIGKDAIVLEDGQVKATEETEAA